MLRLVRGVIRDTSRSETGRSGAFEEYIGAIRPGAGAGKTLPEVGDIFITGIVNVSGSFEQLLLQTTRLATIFHMAESISQGILLACRELEAAGTSELLL